MTNFLFISHDVLIEHSKISIKFDNYRKGKARISFRLAMILESAEDDPVLYTLIKNGESNAKYIRAEKDYNQRLEEGQFRKAAGAYSIKERTEKYEGFSLFSIENFSEAPKLEKRAAIHPRDIICEYLNYEDVPDFLRNKVNTRDIVLKINIPGIKNILCTVDNTNMNVLENVPKILQCVNEPIWILQFRIYLQDFVPEGTLRCWKSSSKSWSVDFDIHKRRNYEDLIDGLERAGFLRYPKSLELWFTIPHSHQFVASSPVYEKAFQMKPEDLAYERRNMENEKNEIGEFETQEGDYSVKIMNNLEHFVELSVICTSPFLSGEKPEELSRRIKEFEEKSPQFVRWGDIMYPLGLFLAFLTLIFAVVSVFVSGLTQNPQLKLTLFTIISAAIFFGLSVWGISMLCYILFSPQSVKKRVKGIASLMTETATRTKFLTAGIGIAVVILMIGLIILLSKQISSLL